MLETRGDREFNSEETMLYVQKKMPMQSTPQMLI